MNLHTFYTRRAIGLVILLALVGLFMAFQSFNNFIYQEKQGDNMFEPYRASLSGEYVCLPHIDTTGPQTLECVFGLKTDTGEYYGIDFFLMSQTHDPIEIGQRISANGTVVPAERLSAAHWQQYPIEGIFSVTDSLEVLPLRSSE